MTTDLVGNQIAGFYPGASASAELVSVRDVGETAIFGFVGATSLEVMRRHARELAESGCRLMYDPSQQLVSISTEDLLEGIGYAWAVIGSDYEMAVIGQKTGYSVADLVERIAFVGVTLGKHGSELYFDGQYARIPPAPAEEVGDPTGGGDAYRAGLLKGLLLGLPLDVVGRMGSVAATYSVERHGPQEHVYTADEFVTRFDRVFPDYAGAVEADWLRGPVARETAVERLASAAVKGD
jgi:adenosine kinase